MLQCQKYKLIYADFLTYVNTRSTPAGIKTCHLCQCYVNTLGAYILNLFKIGESHGLVQRFSTWGTRTPRGTWKDRRGYAKFQNQLKIRPFYGHWGTILMKFKIWGYSFGTTFIKGYNFGKKLIWGYASTKRLRTPDLV